MINPTRAALLIENYNDQISLEEKAEKPDLDLIEARFKHFNKTLFNGALPELPLKTKRTKTHIMAIISMGKRERGRVVEMTPDHISVSSLYSLSGEKLDGIVCHELCHIKLIVDGVYETSGRDKSHGQEFKELIKQTQAKVDFDIPLDETPDAEVADGQGKVQPVVLTITKSNGNIGVMPVSKKVLDDPTELKVSIQRWLDHYKDKYSFKLGTSDHPALQAYPVKRNGKKIVSYVVDSVDDQKAILDSLKVTYES
jgi:hypothetical protein